LQITPRSGTINDIKDLSLPFDTAFVPFWYLPSDSQSGQEIEKVGSAISHVEPGRPIPLANKRIGICPYAMLRKDKDSVDTEKPVSLEIRFSPVSLNKCKSVLFPIIL